MAITFIYKLLRNKRYKSLFKKLYKGGNMKIVESNQEIKDIRDVFDVIMLANNTRIDRTPGNKKTHSQVAFVEAFHVQASNFSNRNIRNFGTTEYIMNTLVENNIIPTDTMELQVFVNRVNQIIDYSDYEHSDSLHKRIFSNYSMNLLRNELSYDFVLNIVEYFNDRTMYLKLTEKKVLRYRKEYDWIELMELHENHPKYINIVNKFESDTIIKGITLKDMYIEPLFNPVKGEVSVNYKELDKLVYEWINDIECFEFTFSKADILLIVGDPGQGKSSFCSKLMYDYVKEKSEVEISRKIYRINLVDINSKILDKKMECNETVLLNEFVDKNRYCISKEELYGGVLILDGYDELHIGLSESGYNAVSFFEALEDELLYLNKDIKVIVTSRKTCLDYEMINSIPIVEIQNLNLIQQIEWIKIYKKKYPKGYYDESILRRLHHQDDYIKELLGIPILFQLIVYYDFKPNIDCQVEVYSQLFADVVLKRVYSRLKRQHKSTKSIKHDLLLRTFEDIACQIYKLNDQYFVRKEMEIEYAEEFFESKLLNSFYFKNRDNYSIEIVEFSHRSFYQYFLSRFLYNKLFSLSSDSDIIDYFDILSYRVLDDLVIAFIHEMYELNISTKAKYYITDKILTKEMTKRIITLLMKCGPSDNKQTSYYQTKHQFENIVRNTFTILFEIAKEDIMVDYECKDITFKLITKYDLNGIRLRYQKLSGEKKSAISFSGISFENFDLSNNKLTDSSFSSVSFREVQLYNSNLSRSFFNKCEFKGGNYQYLNVSGSSFLGTKFEKVNLNNSKFNRTFLPGTIIKGGKITDAEMNDCSLVNSKLYGVDISRSVIKESNFSNVRFQDLVAINTNFKGTSFKNSTFNVANLKGAVLTNTVFDNSKLDRANLRNAKLIAARFRMTSMIGVNIEGCKVHGADLSFSNLKGLRYGKLDFRYMNIIGCLIDGYLASYLNDIKDHDVELRVIERRYVDRLLSEGLMNYRSVQKNVIDANEGNDNTFDYDIDEYCYDCMSDYRNKRLREDVSVLVVRWGYMDSYESTYKILKL